MKLEIKNNFYFVVFTVNIHKFHWYNDLLTLGRLVVKKLLSKLASKQSYVLIVLARYNIHTITEH